MTQNKISWNVIGDTEFKTRAKNVFEQVADTLAKSLGPFGSTTILERMGEYHFTKDGWAILRRIVYNNSLEQNILVLLMNISGQVVAKVGDGSTSSIVAAYNLFEQLGDSPEFAKVRPRNVIDKLNKAVDLIVEKINDKSTKVNTETFDDIYDLALVSLNGDEELAGMIKNIYVETKNPSIEYLKTNEPKSSYEIIDGYQAPIKYLDQIYANREDGSLHMKFPLFLLFDHSVNMDDHLQLIKLAEGQASQSNQQLIVVAPQYDRVLLDYIRSEANREMRTNGKTNTIFASIPLTSNKDHKTYGDFAVMAGAQIINTYVYGEIIAPTQEAFERDENLASSFISQDTVKRLWECVGMTDKMIMTSKSTFISGFTNRNETMYETVRKSAQAEMEDIEEKHRSMNLVNSDLYEAKKRLSKLTGKMGRINVGGQSSLARNATADLVDDAVKSCESAYRNGYNVGGNIIIPVVIDELLAKGNIEDEEVVLLLDLIRQSFVEVYSTVLYNRYDAHDVEDQKLVNEILEQSYDQGMCYDLTTDEFNNRIINSSQADVEILKGAVSIVGLILSSNQYLTIAPTEAI